MHKLMSTANESANRADLVAIPGAESTLGAGRYSRPSLMLSAAEHFTGAHTGKSQYFARDKPSCDGSHFDRVLRLKSVCWLAVGGTLNGVPRGRYEAVVRCRLTCSPNFKADWRIGVGVHHQRDFADLDLVEPLRMKNDHARGRGGKLLQSLPRDRFTDLSFGVLTLEQKSDVRFEMGGGNPGWCSGLEFDCMELRPVGEPWSVVRLVFLGARDEACVMSRLSPDLVRSIVSLLG